ncbi:hypothetical protein FRC02_008044 [Tulasnella sp. 418]|nr:hypothetical protein FRC02_008044 [Tulasnella sp. 418]
MASLTLVKTSVTLFLLSCFATSANAFFRMGADVLLAARMDPIVSPGAVSQHMHNIVGGNNFAADYNYDELRKSTCTTVPVSVDLSNYWAPGLVYVNKTDNSFTRIPSYFFIYYLQRRGSNPNLKINQWPKGFKMVAGNPNRRSYTPNSNADKAVSFVCLDYSGKVSTGDMEKFIPHNCPGE